MTGSTFFARPIFAQPRHDWTRAKLEALFEPPFGELVFAPRVTVEEIRAKAEARSETGPAIFRQHEDA